MQKYLSFINTSTRHLNLSANCAMICMTTTSFSQPVAGAWRAMCWATEESRGGLKRSGRLLELKLNWSIWNVNNAYLLGKIGERSGTPSGPAFPPHLLHPRRNTGEWQNTRWWHPGAIGCGVSVIGILMTYVGGQAIPSVGHLEKDWYDQYLEET